MGCVDSKCRIGLKVGFLEQLIVQPAQHIATLAWAGGESKVIEGLVFILVFGLVELLKELWREL